MAPRIRTQDLSPAKLRRQKDEKVPMVKRDKVYKQKNSGDSRDLLPVTRVINVARKGITPARKEITPATERFNVSGVPLKRVMINNGRASVPRTGVPLKRVMINNGRASVPRTEIPKGALLPDVKKKKKTDERFPTPKSFIHRGVVQKQIDRNRASMVASHLHPAERMVTSVIQTRRLEALRFLKCVQMKKRAKKTQSRDSLNLSRKLDETNATSKDYESVESNLLRDLSSCRLKIIMSNEKIKTLKSELRRIPKGDYTKWHGVLRSKTAAAAMGKRHGEVEWEKKRAEVREEMSRYNLVLLQFHQLKSVWKEARNKKCASLIIEEAKKSELLKEAATLVDSTTVHSTALALLTGQ